MWNYGGCTHLCINSAYNKHVLYPCGTDIGVMSLSCTVFAYEAFFFRYFKHLTKVDK